MDAIVYILLVFVAVAGVAAFIFALICQRQAARATHDSWREAARFLNLEYVHGPGESGMPARPRIEGEYGGFEVRISLGVDLDEYTGPVWGSSAKKIALTETRFRMKTRTPVKSSIDIHPKDLFDFVDGLLPGDKVDIADDEFSRKYAVYSADRPFVDRVLDREIVGLIMALKNARIAVREDYCVVELTTEIRDADAIIEATKVLATLVEKAEKAAT